MSLSIISRVALFTRAWIEISPFMKNAPRKPSPSSRGRGLKYCTAYRTWLFFCVALFTRAWIEIVLVRQSKITGTVALFTRAWIEMGTKSHISLTICVALFTRAWIEINRSVCQCRWQFVALFTRAWIEMSTSTTLKNPVVSPSSRGRGLKCIAFPNKRIKSQSPSSRGRGLKLLH